MSKQRMWWGTHVNGLADKMRDSGQALVRVFRHPDLRRLQLAFIGSIIGDRAYIVAIGVYAYAKGGPTAVGIVVVIRYVAMALSFPIASMLADRHSRRRVMLISDLVCATFAATGAVVIAADGPSVLVYALVIATAVAGTCFRPAQAALLPSLARDPGELTAANVASNTIESVGFFAGPALAGLVLALSSVQIVFAMNAVSFLWSAMFVLRLSTPRPRLETGEEKEPESFFSHASVGFRTILADRSLRLVIGLFCAQTVVAGASAVFVVSIALDLLDIGQSGVGYLEAVFGVGALVGGFAALVLAQRSKLALDFGVGVLLWSVPLLLIAVRPTVAAAAVALVVMGLGNSVVDINGFTIVQRAVPDEVMGRVFGALESALIGSMALGALLMPLLIETAGIRTGIAAIGGGVAVITLLGSPGLVRVDRTVLAPPGLDLLRGIPIFSPLPETIIERLARALIPIEISAGTVVITEGHEGDRVYVIEEGTVAVSKEGRWVANLGPGDIVGEIALLRDVPRTATVTATTAAKLQALERDVFIPAVTGHHDVQEMAETAITARLAML
jgi:MFS family permease